VTAVHPGRGKANTVIVHLHGKLSSCVDMSMPALRAAACLTALVSAAQIT